MRNSGRKEEIFNNSRSKGIFNINFNDKKMQRKCSSKFRDENKRIPQKNTN